MRDSVSLVWRRMSFVCRARRRGRERRALTRTPTTTTDRTTTPSNHSSPAPLSPPQRNAATNETNGDKALARAQELTKTLESKVDELDEKNATLVAHCKSIGLLLDSDAGEGGEWLHVC